MIKIVWAALAAGVMAAGSAGCKKPATPLERAGQEIGEAMEDAGETIDDGLHHAGHEMHEAGEEVEDAVTK